MWRVRSDAADEEERVRAQAARNEATAASASLAPDDGAAERGSHAAMVQRVWLAASGSGEKSRRYAEGDWFRCMDSNHDSGIQSPLSCL
jgi:hypothetical protein